MSRYAAYALLGLVIVLYSMAVLQERDEKNASTEWSTQQ